MLRTRPPAPWYVTAPHSCSGKSRNDWDLPYILEQFLNALVLNGAGARECGCDGCGQRGTVCLDVDLHRRKNSDPEETLAHELDNDQLYHALWRAKLGQVRPLPA